MLEHIHRQTDGRNAVHSRASCIERSPYINDTVIAASVDVAGGNVNSVVFGGNFESCVRSFVFLQL